MLSRSDTQRTTPLGKRSHLITVGVAEYVGAAGVPPSLAMLAGLFAASLIEAAERPRAEPHEPAAWQFDEVTIGAMKAAALRIFDGIGPPYDGPEAFKRMQELCAYLGIHGSERELIVRRLAKQVK
jgi:hypothetical protein